MFVHTGWHKYHLCVSKKTRTHFIHAQQMLTKSDPSISRRHGLRVRNVEIRVVVRACRGRQSDSIMRVTVLWLYLVAQMTRTSVGHYHGHRPLLQCRNEVGDMCEV